LTAKSGLLGTLSALALGVGLGLAPAEVAAQQATQEVCRFIETLGADDITVLQAVAAGDVSDIVLQRIPGITDVELASCQEAAVNRLLGLLNVIQPAGGPPGGGPAELYF
jgi:hypothetical protein